MPLPSLATVALSVMRRDYPSQWREIVRRALADTGSIPAAARALGFTQDRTLYRWLYEEPSLREGIRLPRTGSRKKNRADVGIDQTKKHHPLD